MIKFQFNLSAQTLKIVSADHFLVIFEEWKFFTQFGGIGFRLDSEKPHWISFHIYKEKVLCFYKFPHGEEITYYKREVTRPLSGIIEVEFSEWDRVEKKRGKWISKTYDH